MTEEGERVADDLEDITLIFRVLDAQADTQFIDGGGWERAIQYRLSSVSPEEAEGRPASGEPALEASLRIEYVDGLEPNPHWGRMFMDEALGGEGRMMFLFMRAPLEAVEALIRDAETECPRAVAVFAAPPRRRVARVGERARRGARSDAESTSNSMRITRILLTTTLAEAYDVTGLPSDAP